MPSQRDLVWGVAQRSGEFVGPSSGTKYGFKSANERFRLFEQDLCDSVVKYNAPNKNPRPGAKPDVVSAINKSPYGGPGTELRKMFESMAKKLGVKYPGCGSCEAKRLEMDQKGADWCLENIDELAKDIGSRIRAKKIPVMDVVVKQFIKRAVRKSKAT